MDLDKIKLLIDAMATSDLAELELIEDGWTLRLSRSPKGASEAIRPAPANSTVAKPFAAVAGNAAALTAAMTAAEIQAPLSGVVYLRPAPDKPPFVVAGQAIKAGTPVCVIEAMKVFNEVRAERDGTVEAVLVASGHEVEAGQTLLRLARSPG